VEIFAIFGPRSNPRASTGVKFCTSKQLDVSRAHVPLGCAKFHVNQRNESPHERGNADFRPVRKFKYRLMPLDAAPLQISKEYGNFHWGTAILQI